MKNKSRKTKAGADLYPETGDPFDKAEGAMDNLQMPKMKNDGLGDSSDMFGKQSKGQGFGGFDQVGDGGFGGYGGSKKSKGRKKQSEMGGFGENSGYESLGSLGDEKSIGKKVRKGKKSFENKDNPFSMFDGENKDKPFAMFD